MMDELDSFPFPLPSLHQSSQLLNTCKVTMTLGFPMLLYDILMHSCLGLRATRISSPQQCPFSPWILLLWFQVLTDPSKGWCKCHQQCWKLVCSKNIPLRNRVQGAFGLLFLYLSLPHSQSADNTVSFQILYVSNSSGGLLVVLLNRKQIFTLSKR